MPVISRSFFSVSTWISNGFCALLQVKMALLRLSFSFRPPDIPHPCDGTKRLDVQRAVRHPGQPLDRKYGTPHPVILQLEQQPLGVTHLATPPPATEAPLPARGRTDGMRLQRQREVFSQMGFDNVGTYRITSGSNIFSNVLFKKQWIKGLWNFCPMSLVFWNFSNRYSVRGSSGEKSFLLTIISNICAQLTAVDFSLPSPCSANTFWGVKTIPRVCNGILLSRGGKQYYLENFYPFLLPGTA